MSDLSEIFTQVSTHILLHLMYKKEKSKVCDMVALKGISWSSQIPMLFTVFRPFPVEKLFSDFSNLFPIFELRFFYDLLLLDLGPLLPKKKKKKKTIPHGSPHCCKLYEMRKKIRKNWIPDAERLNLISDS